MVGVAGNSAEEDRRGNCGLCACNLRLAMCKEIDGINFEVLRFGVLLSSMIL